MKASIPFIFLNVKCPACGWILNNLHSAAGELQCDNPDCSEEGKVIRLKQPEIELDALDPIGRPEPSHQKG